MASINADEELDELERRRILWQAMAQWPQRLTPTIAGLQRRRTTDGVLSPARARALCGLLPCYAVGVPWAIAQTSLLLSP